MAVAAFVANVLQVFSTGDVVCPARGCAVEIDEETVLMQFYRANPMESDEGISGTYTTEITHVQAVQSNGVPLPGTNARPCFERYSFLADSSVWYQVDYHRGIGNATAIVFGQRVALNPTGIAHTYDFVSDAIPEYLHKTLHIGQVWLRLKPKGKLLEHEISMLAPAPSSMAGPASQCVFKSRTDMRPIARSA